jgi:hypothetical protein
VAELIAEVAAALVAKAAVVLLKSVIWPKEKQ